MQAYRTSLAIELLEAALLRSPFAHALRMVRPSRGGEAPGPCGEAVLVVVVLLAGGASIAECALGPARKLMTR